MNEVVAAKLVVPASGQNSLPRLPVYVEHGGEIACRHPADAINSRLYGFLLRADRQRLDRFCDRMFNQPTGNREHWQAVGDEVLLNFVDIPTMGSTDLLDQRLGVCHEREVAIWFPVVDRKRHRFAWAIPYMFVDSALALAGGREVYGFPKQLGTIEVPVGEYSPAQLSIDTVTLRRHSPTSVANNYRVITVERPGEPVALGPTWDHPLHALAAVTAAMGGDAVPAAGNGVLQSLPAMFREAAELRGEIETALLFFAQMVEEDIPMLLLKQFRDAHEQGAACYQALVWVDMAVSLFRSGGLLPEGYRVSIEALDGEPITRELGIPRSCRPRASFWLDFDFIVRLGDILWEADCARP